MSIIDAARQILTMLPRTRNVHFKNCQAALLDDNRTVEMIVIFSKGISRTVYYQLPTGVNADDWDARSASTMFVALLAQAKGGAG